MTYCETIESSKNWTCPKTGIWKVICIGGGGGGYGYYKGGTFESVGGAGGTTSFGTYLSAVGGSAGSHEKALFGFSTSGYYKTGAVGTNGYNGASIYGTPSNGATGVGYGASGGAKCFNDSVDVASAGDPGDVKTTILDLTVNSTVACTIGAAGAEGEKKVTGVAVNAKAYAGKSGAIILQYLGSAM